MKYYEVLVSKTVYQTILIAAPSRRALKADKIPWPLLEARNALDWCADDNHRILVAEEVLPPHSGIRDMIITVGL